VPRVKAAPLTTLVASLVALLCGTPVSASAQAHYEGSTGPRSAYEIGEPWNGDLVLAPIGTQIDVVADTGKETRGRLLRFDADSLTIEGRDGEVSFDRRQVARIYQRGDSLKNGMWIGLGIGAALGSAIAVTTECGGFLAPIRSCTAGEKAQLAGVLGGVFGGLGLGIGVGIDALFTGRRLLYDGRSMSRPRAWIAPGFGQSGTRLLLTVAW
jgi:hypothetical protein